ncbi:MAG: hypothetical protein WC536_01185 [Patescibacteria group bacterium]
MKTLKLGLVMALIIPMLAGIMAVAKADPAKAQGFSNTNNLGSLIVSNGLFTGYNAVDLAGLIATDAVTSGGSFSSGTSNLNDLLVLGGLFGTGGGWGWNNGAQNLAGLIAVDNLYNGGI